MCPIFFRIKIGSCTHDRKSYQYGMIKSVNLGCDDKIRDVVVEYQNPNENIKRMTTRAIRTLVLIIGVDEIDLSKELFQSKK